MRCCAIRLRMRMRKKWDDLLLLFCLYKVLNATKKNYVNDNEKEWILIKW